MKSIKNTKRTVLKNLWVWIRGFHLRDKLRGEVWHGLLFIHCTLRCYLLHYCNFPENCKSFAFWNANEKIFCIYFSENLRYLLILGIINQLEWFFWSVKLDSRKHNLDYVILCSQNFNLFLIEKNARSEMKYFSHLSLSQGSNSVSGNVMWSTICPSITPIEQVIFSSHFRF